MLLIIIIMLLLFVTLMYCMWSSNNSNSLENMDNYIEKIVKITDNGELSWNQEPFMEIIPHWYKATLYNDTSFCNYNVILCDQTLHLEKLIKRLINTTIINNSSIGIFKTHETNARNITLHLLHIDVFANGFVIVRTPTTHINHNDQLYDFSDDNYSFAFVDSADEKLLNKLIGETKSIIVVVKHDEAKLFLQNNGFITQLFDVMVHNCEILLTQIK
ncbi:unknown [Neodiprion lecontei nucleopolyhedrovirus]|uniref:Uncharacterized protein n=1 Tax=Neodiprion lecontei nucleopolyhedrovirus (strain Canada) TaxID=654906 RepID=Q6JPF3_NPVNC|nr:unknown [Neodiprion lecontei nucleopolyhedrovirus]AAQ99131.1 unknown [Neodiprion lecontei nucleopolyhedrovirus]